MDKVFSLVREHKGQRLDYTPLMDGQWWVLDFGDTGTPGVTYKINLIAPSPANGQLRSLRRLMWLHHGKKLQSRQVPALDIGVRLVRLHVRVMNPDDYYAAIGFGQTKVDGL